MRRAMIVAGVFGVCLSAAPVRAAEPLPPAIREARALADQIDRLVASRWTEKNVKPAEAAGDGEFLRRAHLDLTGRIPLPKELLDFRDYAADNVRERWIHDKLLESPEYVNHFAATWKNLIVANDNNVMFQPFGPTIEQWLKQKFRENAHYDQIARELLASPYGQQNTVTTAFFQANQLKPENVAATTSRLFLGVKIECAQCHNHPFARWQRTQFWEFAAFFSGVEARMVAEGQMPAATENPNKREITIPDTEKKVQARFLDGTEPQWKDGTTTRETLAEWLLRRENPFFARAAVNRLWAHFFGVGMVEPVDDLHDQNPASHPELLDLLAREFAAHDFDVKFLIRAITYSKTYQLSSRVSDPSQTANPRLFARMNLKGLSGEQLFDSIHVAAGIPLANQVNMNQQPNSPRLDFVTRFASQNNRTEHETSILQALTLMNGSLMKTVIERSMTHRGLQGNGTLYDAIFQPLDTGQRVETLYLAVFTRKPRPDELERFVKYIDGGGPRKDTKVAIQDVFWALINSSEFLLNH